jgi:hypothetical protein
MVGGSGAMNRSELTVSDPIVVRSVTNGALGRFDAGSPRLEQFGAREHRCREGGA